MDKRELKYRAKIGGWSAIVTFMSNDETSSIIEKDIITGTKKGYALDFEIERVPFESKFTKDTSVEIKIIEKPEMKFFEFNEFSYSALIAAKSMEEAIECYKEQVADIDNIDGTPDEITREEAEAQYIGNSEDKRSFDEFISDGLPTVILMDSDLV